MPCASTFLKHEKMQNALIKYSLLTKEAKNVMSTRFALFRELDTTLHNGSSFYARRTAYTVF